MTFLSSDGLQPLSSHWGRVKMKVKANVLRLVEQRPGSHLVGML